MTGGMALAGDHFRENKESSAYWGRPDEGSSDFFDEYVILDDDDSLGPVGHTSRSYYADLGFAPPADSVLSPPTSIDTSQLLSLDGSADGVDHLQPQAALSSHHTRRCGSHTPGPQRLTQHTLEQQSAALSSSAQRRLNSAVSDSEIQRLEELSMQSPRRGTAPPPSHSIPTSPRSQQPAGPAQSPKKLSRMEMIYASIRRKATTMRVRKMSSAPIGSDRDDEELQRGRCTKPVSQLPITPPPTGRMLPATPSQHDPLGISFVSGPYDDPFDGSFAGQQGQVLGYPPPQPGYPTGMMMSSDGQAPPNWPLTDGYASSSGNSADEMMWAGNSHQQHNIPQTPANQAWYPGTPGNPMKSVTRQSSSEFGAANAMNATLNLALHLQQGGQMYHNSQQQQQHHYGPVAGGHHHSHSESGLSLHMPQPRHRAAPILHPSQEPQHHAQHQGQGHSHTLSLDGHAQPYFAPPTHHHSRPPRAGHDPSTPRRPKPRAPSSGARHTSLSLTSPRKPPPLPHQPRGRSSSSSPDKSTSAARSARRVTSASDLHSAAPSKCELPSTTSAAGGVLNSSIRKRRSRSKSMSRTSRSDLRTPSHGSLSSANGSPVKGGGGQIGFVNYTPDDSKVLMTGVAPSGSSKTKARREREAAERQRRLSEAVMKAVAAAGGDVARLKEEGIVLDGVGDDGMGGIPMVY